MVIGKGRTDQGLHHLSHGGEAEPRKKGKPRHRNILGDEGKRR